MKDKIKINDKNKDHVIYGFNIIISCVWWERTKSQKQVKSI